MVSRSVEVLLGIYPIDQPRKTRLWLLAALSCLLLAGIALPSLAGATQADEDRMVSRFEAAMAKGDQTTALRHVLDYSERTYGEYAPVTIRVMHRFGYALYKDGEYREAIDILRETLERSTQVHGEFGGEAYEINMNLGHAYSHRRDRWGPRLKYFDRALEVLRERGERESITYVATLVNIVINLLDSDSHLKNLTSNLQCSRHVLTAIGPEPTFFGGRCLQIASIASHPSNVKRERGQSSCCAL